MQNRLLLCSLFVCLVVSAIIKSGDVWLSNGKDSIVGKYSLLKCASTLYSASSNAYFAAKGESDADKKNGVINIYAHANGSLLKQIQQRTEGTYWQQNFAVTDDYLVSGLNVKDGLWVDSILGDSSRNITLSNPKEYGDIGSMHVVPNQLPRIACIGDWKLFIVDIEAGYMSHIFKPDTLITKMIPDNTGNGFWLERYKQNGASSFTLSHYDVRAAKESMLPLETHDIFLPFCSNPSNKHCAIYNYDTVTIFDVTANKCVRTINVPEKCKTGTLFFADDSTIIYNTENKDMTSVRDLKLEVISLQTADHRSACSLDSNIGVLRYHHNTKVLVGTTNPWGPGLVLYDFGVTK